MNKDLPEGSVILHIGRTSSMCGACGRPCLPREASHITPCGYGTQKPGCGATYTHVRSEYPDAASVAATNAMRPDLIPLSTKGF